MNKTFAEKLKEARKTAGLTQKTMVDRMLMPRRTLEDWERGINVPPEYVQRFVLNELEDIAGERAGRKANLSYIKSMMESHEEWKASHPRPKSKKEGDG